MKSLKKLIEILDRWKYLYILSAFLLLASVIFRMLEPRVLQIAVDTLIAFFSGSAGDNQHDVVTSFFKGFLPGMKPENLFYILVSLGLIFLVISVLRGIFMFASSAISASSTEKAVKRLRDRLFKHIQLLPMSYYGRTPTGELVQRCTGDVETVRKFASLQVVEAMRMISLFASALVMMLMIDTAYAFIAIALLPVITFGSFYFFKKETRVWTAHEKEQDRLTSLVQENLTGIRVVKAFAKEDFEMDKFTRQNKEKRKWGLRLLKLHRMFWPSSDLVVHLQIALSVFAGGYFVLNGNLTVGEYVAFYYYAILVTWPMRRLGQLTSEAGMTNAAIERIYSILDHPTEDYSGKDDRYRGFMGAIEFSNVFFNYDKNESKHVLKGISFKAGPGEKIAILGPTGSGKSTLIALLMRFYEPDSGNIRIDGTDIREIPRAFLRNRIGVVHQKPFLFSTSIKDNIAYSRPDTHVNEIVESAKTAKIHDIIEEAFPGSYDTVVGEKGVTLSGGQKQRVTIARTLVKNPDILVLDDSTSSVDTETEFGIQQALRGFTKGKTTLIIAHRVTSVQDCDRIIVLDKGSIAEEGTHEELMACGGFYRKIHDIQVSIEKEIGDEMQTSGETLMKKKKDVLYNDDIR